jgi:hypothetical protein
LCPHITPCGFTITRRPPPGNGSARIFFGGDQGAAPSYRKGVLYFFNNKVVVQSSQTGPNSVYKINLLDMNGGGQTLDARDDIFVAISQIVGQYRSDLGLVSAYDTAYFGRDWIMPNWTPTTFSGYTFYG